MSEEEYLAKADSIQQKLRELNTLTKDFSAVGGVYRVCLDGKWEDHKEVFINIIIPPLRMRA